MRKHAGIQARYQPRLALGMAHVGCDIVWKISATDVNNHTMRVEVDADTPLPEGAEMVTIKSGVTTHKELRWTPRRGMEGSFYTICWREGW